MNLALSGFDGSIPTPALFSDFMQLGAFAGVCACGGTGEDLDPPGTPAGCTWAGGMSPALTGSGRP